MGLEPYYENAGIFLYTGDARAVLRELAPESVQCCVTSPPFFGLRDYGTGRWQGGSSECDHRKASQASIERAWQTSTLATRNDKRTGHSQEGYGQVCGKCGAIRVDYQIGMEATIDDYVAALVNVFREVRRVLKNDGVMFLEIGDSYSGAGYSNHRNTGGAQREDGGKQKHTSSTTLGPKQLLMIPARVALALQADGWVLRRDIIWARSNPMPESVQDRCSTSHSYVFHFAKQQRYYYDGNAIREAAVTLGQSSERPATTGAAKRAALGELARTTPVGRSCGLHETGMRNKRSVWTINPEPFLDGDHFAVMPTALVKPCILAGSRPGDTVLDPFVGSGTVALVAKRLGRKAIGIDLNAEYVNIAIKRLEKQTPELAGFAAAFSAEVTA